MNSNDETDVLKALNALKAGERLPSPKGVALEVFRLIRKDDVTNQQVAQAIKSDPTLSGRVIKVANSLVAYQTRPIASVVDAVSVLGFNTVRQLVLGLSLMEENRTGVCQRFDYQDFWAQSLLTAITAQNLVMQSGVGSTEEVFILGLLGQIGSLALATAYPQEYSRVLDALALNANSDLVSLERTAFGFDHNQLSKEMLADWGMPQVFQDVVLHHEAPAQSSLTEGGRSWHLLNVLHIANYFSSVCLAHEAHRRKMVPKLILLATRQGVELDALAQLGDKSVKAWHDWSKFCGIRSAEVPLFAELFEAVPLVPSMIEDTEELPNGTGTFYKMRILLVDDDRATLVLLKTLLEKAGHTVITAGNGIEGLALIEKFRPQLIITDWMMPEMSGIEFCKALRQNSAWRNIYVFIMTAQDGLDRLVEAFEAGANDYMTKPVSPKALLARLRAGQRVVQLQEEMEFDRQQLRKFADELAASNHRLRKSDVSMRAILDNAPYMAWLKDAEGRYIRVNKTYVDYVKPQDNQQIIGKTDFDLWSKERAERYRAVDAEVMSLRQPKRIEETLLKGEKKYWLETIETPVIDENGVVLGTTGFVRDITEQINQEALRITEVRKQRDALVREVHHRIKNNLQGVVGLLRQQGIDHPEMEETIKVVTGRIYSIAIIHGLQAQGVSEEVELGKLMKSIIDASGIPSGYQNDLAHPVFLRGDETVPVALVLNELYTNACKHRTSQSMPAVRLKDSGADTLISITNHYNEQLPAIAGNGQGLNLIKSLLPSKSTRLNVTATGGIYTVELKLSAPVTINANY